MRLRRYGIPIAFLLVVLTTLGALCWRPFQQAWAVADLNACFDPARIVALSSAGVRNEQRPDRMPASWDDFATRVLATVCRDPLLRRKYQENLRSMFRAPFDTVKIYSAPTSGNPGLALQRLKNLREVVLLTSSKSMSEAEWKELCTGLRGCPKLEKVRFVSTDVSDAAIAPLAGHPTLSEVTVMGSKFMTQDCASTFATMPKLQKLYVINDKSVLSDAPVTIKKALPKVRVLWASKPTPQAQLYRAAHEASKPPSPPVSVPPPTLPTWRRPSPPAPVPPPTLPSWHRPTS